MRVLVLQTVASLQKQVDQGVAVVDLAMPFGGIEIGAPRDCVARDFNEVFEVACRLGGAFGVSAFGSTTKPSDDTRQAFDEWAQGIRQALSQWPTSKPGADFDKAFNVSVKLATGKRGRIGFLGHTYAANFGVLRPGRSASSDTRGLKVKIFDLEALRHGDMVDRDVELLVGAPTIGADSPYSRREAETLAESWDFIDFEARRRGVKAMRYAGTKDAAAHLAQRASTA